MKSLSKQEKNMSKPIEIPEFLQDREGPSLSDKASEFQKKISRRMGRLITDISFDKSSVYISDYDDDNPEKYDQDKAFATYEENLKDSHLQDKIDRVKRFGSLVLVLPGLHAIGEGVGDYKRSQDRLKQKRSDFVKRNGTMKSRMRDRYIKHKQKYPD